MPDLISCEVCGMHWTPKPHESCPRCELGYALRTRDALQAKLVEVREDADKGWAMARGNREWSMRERVEDKRTIEELVEANRVADATLERVEKELDTAVAELECLLAHARDTAAENLSDKRAIQARCAELEKERDEVWKVRRSYLDRQNHVCGIDLGRQPEDMLTESLRSPETRSEFLAEWSRDADTILKGLQEKAKASESRCKALEEALREAHAALQHFSCDHYLVCADPACREAGHEHEGYGEDWCCAEYCPCVPACAGFEPDTCPGSRIVSEIIEGIGAALSDKLPTGITPGQCGCQCHDKVYGCNAPADDHGSCCLGGGKQ